MPSRTTRSRSSILLASPLNDLGPTLTQLRQSRACWRTRTSSPASRSRSPTLLPTFPAAPMIAITVYLLVLDSTTSTLSASPTAASSNFELVQKSNLCQHEAMPRDEYCPVYKSLDLFGDRWGLLLVREILRGVTRFNELERSLPGDLSLDPRATTASPGEGSDRRTSCRRRRHRTEYGLTEAGRELVSVIQAVGDWGLRWLVPDARPPSPIRTD